MTAALHLQPCQVLHLRDRVRDDLDQKGARIAPAPVTAAR
jgi:hypothetical protein